MRIRMRMGDVDGDGSYLYVCRYVYVCICAYLMQCVVLSRLYGFVGRQYCTYSYRYKRERERGGNTTTTNDIRYIPTLVGVSQLFGKTTLHTLPQRLSPKPTLSHANPPENSQRERKRGDLYPLSKLHCKSVYLSPMWIQVGSTLLIRVLIKSKLQTTRKKYHQDDEFRIMCPF